MGENGEERERIEGGVEGFRGCRLRVLNFLFWVKANNKNRFLMYRLGWARARNLSSLN